MPTQLNSIPLIEEMREEALYLVLFQGPFVNSAQLRDSGPVLLHAAAVHRARPVRRVHRLRGALPHHPGGWLRGDASEGEQKIIPQKHFNSTTLITSTVKILMSHSDLKSLN